MSYPHNPQTFPKRADALTVGDLIVRLPGHQTDEYIDRVHSVETVGITVKVSAARFWTSPERHPDRVDGLTVTEYIGRNADLSVTYEQTDIILAQMLTENTGRHFLDSGSAYGRSWERNRAASGNNPVEYFRNQSEIWQGWRGEEWAVLSVFHYLRERVEYCHPLTHAFRLFVYANENRYLNGPGDLETFLAAGESRGWFDLSGDHFGGYTYNDENALSQDIVYQTFEVVDTATDADEYSNPFGLTGSFVAISIHNGCDARGGFTDYKIFELTGYEPVYDFLSFGDFETAWECETERGFDPNQTQMAGMPERAAHTFYASTRGGYTEWYSTNGHNLRDEPAELCADDVDPDGTDPFGCYRECPHCEGTMTITGFYPPHTS